MTPSQRQAVLWLSGRGGTGVFDRNNVLIARGERAPFMRSTWNVLRDSGYATIADKRVTLTQAASGVSPEPGPKHRPEGIQGKSDSARVYPVFPLEEDI